MPWRDNITNNYPLFRLINCKLLSGENGRQLHPALQREQLAYTSVDHIACVSDFACRGLEQLMHVPAEKLTVIRNGVQHSENDYPEKAVLRQKHGFSEDEQILLFAGTVSERKGAFDLITLVERLVLSGRPVRLLIAGGGEHARFLGRISRFWSRITLTGNVNRQTLGEFYRMADVGIVPSFIEQCSYTAVEMVGAGLPLIVADVDGLTEVVPVGGGLKVKLNLEAGNARLDADDLEEK